MAASQTYSYSVAVGKAAFSEGERGIFDAIDATRTADELRTLMQPRWNDPTMGCDELWRLHCERQKRMREEEILHQEYEKYLLEAQKKSKKKCGLARTWLKVVKKGKRVFKSS